MNLFFDSGATKCDCIVTDEHGHYICHHTDTGINASYSPDDEIDAIIARFSSLTGQRVSRIEFAGAGCGNPQNAARVQKAIEAHYRADEIIVESDLAGACRLLSHQQPCLTAILGTGAAACRYDGSSIVEQAPSLGWMLGDEGSGTHLGKLLITRYLKNELSDSCRHALESEFHLDRSEVLRRIYRAPSPNLFFSGFARFIREYAEHDNTVGQLVEEAFNNFILTQIKPISNHDSLPVHLMGSVAWHYRNFIETVAERHGITIGNVAASPLQIIQDSKA